MQKQPSFSDPDAYVSSIDGWRRRCVDRLRASVLTQGKLRESVKWGHLVYESNGPVLLIRAEPGRVLFGFWRGQRLRGIEPALHESGKYEMATIEFREGMPVDAATARRLAEAAVALNEELGDPRNAAKPRRTAASKRAGTKALRGKIPKASRTGKKTARSSSAAKKSSRSARKTATSRRSRKAGRRGG